VMHTSIATFAKARQTGGLILSGWEVNEHAGLHWANPEGSVVMSDRAWIIPA